ncbi:MAG: hypothetical protein U0236_16900 [Nitrospira sp.]
MRRGLVPEGAVSSVLILFVCVCVLLQMLGAPVTLLGLLMSDAPVESLSEDFSIPPIMPEPGQPSQSTVSDAIQSMRQLPIFSTSVFHPPQA